MGLFSFFQKKKAISAEDQAGIDNFRSSLDALLNTPKEQITAEEYQSIRNAEREWLEAHYDLSTVESIQAIPERKDLPRPPGKGVTGDVYYHLHYKARCYADKLEYALAIACQEKSNALIKLRYGTNYGRKECYYLVKLYARAGLTNQALKEKEKIEYYYGNPAPSSRDYEYAQNMISIAIKQGQDERDYAWIKENLPNMCPQSKNGFCRMRSQNTKNYQRLKESAAKLGKMI